MRNDPLHAAPPDPRTRRRVTRVVLGSAVAVALGGSGVYIANANAAETVVPGRLQAEAFSAQSGVQTENTGDTDGGKNVGFLANGDWLRYDDVTIGSTVTARIASDNAAGGEIELRVGSPTGSLLTTIPVARTGGWQTWVTKTATVKAPAGSQKLVAVMKSAQAGDFVNINWFTFGSATGAPPTAPSTSPATPTGGYVPIDQAAWQRQLAAFDKVTPAKVTAGTTMVPEFHTNCTVANSAPDDPIVLPGLPGASHMHTFFGPKIDANTTAEQILADKKTTCDAPGDFSAYWVPELQKDGQPVPMKSMRVYYASRVKDPSTVKPFPQGLVMVQGDAKQQVPTPKNAGSNQFWCAGSAETGRSADGNMPVCAKGGNLIFQLVFKDCWDGKNLDSPDHKSHMGDPVNGVCTGQYPVAIPNLSFMVNYESLGGDGLKLSSGLPSSMHGDFMDGWDAARLNALVKSCINQSAKCGTTPVFAAG